MTKTYKNTLSKGKNDCSKAFSRVFIIVLILTLTQIMLVSAFEFDNVKDYNYTTNTFKIDNAFGLGATIIEWKRTTPNPNPIIRSASTNPKDWRPVVCYENIYLDYDKTKEQIFTDQEFYNVKENMKEFTRDYDWRVKLSIPFQEMTYIKGCVNQYDKNGDFIKGCDNIENGTITRYRTEYKVIDDLTDIRINDEVCLFTYVAPNEKGEQVPEFAGERINEDSEWTEDLNTGLILYADLDEAEGQQADDSTGQMANATVHADVIQGADGILGTAYECPRAVNTGDCRTVFPDNALMDTITTEGTWSMWVKKIVDDGSLGVIVGRFDDTDNDWNIALGTGASPAQLSFTKYEPEDSPVVLTYASDTILDGSFHHIVTMQNGTGMYIYFDGVIVEENADSDAFDTDTEPIYIGARGDEQREFNGTIDEIAIWNDSKSHAQIIQIYNTGTAITWTDDFSGGADLIDPNVTLSIPANATTPTNATITFNWTVTDDVNVSNSTLVINGVINQTIIYGTDNETTFQVVMEDLTDGSYNWTATALDNSSNSDTTDTWFFTIDAVPPQISLTEITPVATHVRGTNLTINWTESGTDTCILEYSGVNRTVTCGDNGAYINTTDYSKRTVILWANDTGSNTNVTTISWNYDYFENNITYTATVTEGDTTFFEVNFIYNDTKFDVSAIGNLSYDGAQTYASTIGGSGDNRTLNNSISIPSVSGTATNEFYWVILLSNGTVTELNSTFNNQTVNDVAIGTCVSFNNTFMNLTVVDEVSQTALNGTTNNVTVEVEGYLTITGQSEAFMNFSETFSSTNPAELCSATSLNESSYTLTTLMRYDADGYAGEFYNIQNATISNDTIPLEYTLYDLADSRSQIFEIEFKDENFRPVDDAIIQIQRKYIDEGVFKTVEIPKTDYRGLAPANLELDNVVYTLIVTKYGQTLLTQEDVIATCQNPTLSTCSISLNSYSTSSDPDDFTVLEDFTFTITYDEDTRDVESIFTIPSGLSQAVLLNTTLFDGLGKTEVCSDTLTSSSGTLNCIIPANFGNGTVVSTITKAGNFQGRALIKLEQEPEDIYGANLVFVGMFLILTLVGVGIVGSPVIMAIFLILGIVALVVLNLVDASGLIGYGATALWLIIAIIVIIVKGVNRE